MRKLRIFEHISLDGVIEIPMPGEKSEVPYGDWTAPYRSPAGFAMVVEKYGERFDLLLGRRTYDLWSDYWPKSPPNPMADRLNSATKYIVTHRPESLKWGPAEGITGNIVESIRKLKMTSGPDLILAGSSTLTSELIEYGLADEVHMLVYPVMLGKGKRLFKEGTPGCELVFESSIATPTGILINSYKVAGPLKEFPV